MSRGLGDVYKRQVSSLFRDLDCLVIIDKKYCSLTWSVFINQALGFGVSSLFLHPELGQNKGDKCLHQYGICLHYSSQCLPYYIFLICLFNSGTRSVSLSKPSQNVVIITTYQQLTSSTQTQSTSFQMQKRCTTCRVQPIGVILTNISCSYKMK